MRRLAAIIAAAVMILVAVFVRARLDDGGGSGEPLAATVVCATEVAPVCEELRDRTPGLTVRIEEAGTTAATFAAGPSAASGAPVDAWIVPQPYPGVVAVHREQAGLDPVLDEPSAPLARSPLVAVVWIEKEQVLAQGPCPDLAAIWTCLGTVGASPWSSIGGDASWGPVKVGLAPAERAATGLLTLAQASGSRIGTVDYSRADLQDPGYRQWLDTLVRGVPDFNPSAGRALDQMLFQGPSTFDVAASIEAIAVPKVAASARFRNDLDILYPAPDATADVVVAPVRGSAHGGRVTQLLQDDPARELFARHGWRVEGLAPAAGIRDVPLAPTNGLPPAGVFVALGEVWSEVHR